MANGKIPPGTVAQETSTGVEGADYRQTEIDQAEALVKAARERTIEARTHSEFLQRELELKQAILDLEILTKKNAKDGKKLDDEAIAAKLKLLELQKRSTEIQSKIRVKVINQVALR